MPLALATATPSSTSARISARLSSCAPRKPGVRRVSAQSGFIVALKIAFDQIAPWMSGSSAAGRPPRVSRSQTSLRERRIAAERRVELRAAFAVAAHLAGADEVRGQRARADHDPRPRRACAASRLSLPRPFCRLSSQVSRPDRRGDAGERGVGVEGLGEHHDEVDRRVDLARAAAPGSAAARCPRASPAPARAR